MFHHDPFGAHTQCADALANFGIAPPAAWTALRDRFAAFLATDKPMTARLVAAVVDPNSSADIPALRAAALAEEVANNMTEGAVNAVVRAAVHERLRALYEPAAAKNYKTVASQFDDAAKSFTKAANTVDPETGSDAIVHTDDRTRQSWFAAAVAAQQLDELVPVLAAAAELAGAPAGTSHRGPDADPLVLALTTDPDKLHRRRVWEAWAAAGTCGRWSALHRLGATIRTHRDPSRLTPYRPPQPIHVLMLNGGRREIVDPEDNPNTELAEHDWSMH